MVQGFFPGRSAVWSTKGIVATSQPLAAQEGANIAREGGNAVDAAIAACAMLCVTEPMSIGLGGDLFAMVAVPGEERPRVINASGRCPAKLTLSTASRLSRRGAIPTAGPLPITVPGLVAGLDELARKYATRPLEELLRPAIRHAGGFAVTPKIARGWDLSVRKFAPKRFFSGCDFVVREGRRTRGPRAGEVFANPGIGRSLETIARNGTESFYRGELAQEIAAAVEKAGGWLSASDLAEHRCDWPDPISADYRGQEIFEVGPSDQGIVALEMLGIIESERMDGGLEDPRRAHLMIEAKKLAFADAFRHVADPEFHDVPVRELLSKSHARELRAKIKDRASPPPPPRITPGGGTAYLAAADADGWACSLIGSLYYGFGSGVAVRNTGVVLQCRGALFSLDPRHPNALAPRKRPFHTIIPAMAYRRREPSICFGVMGGHHQPQGHVQVLSNLLDLRMDAQSALDAPRWHHDQGKDVVGLETGFSKEFAGALEARGHKISPPSNFNFGGGQVLRFAKSGGTLLLEGGSDPRKDGCAVPL
jgi:gamma-glutamyltranspeptidase/glutathione hydrolase